MSRIASPRVPVLSGARPDAARMSPEERFLAHKAALHQQLIKAMNLTTLATLSEDDLRMEVRRFTEELCRHSSDLLSSGERERLVNG